MNKPDIEYLTSKLLAFEWPREDDPYYNIGVSGDVEHASFRYSGLHEQDLHDILSRIDALDSEDFEDIHAATVLHRPLDEDFSNREQLHVVFVCLYRDYLFLLTFRFCMASCDSSYSAFIAGDVYEDPDSAHIRQAWERAIHLNND